MKIDPTTVIGWLLAYKYLILFPVTVIEGPLVTVIAGFLVSLGKMDFLLSYLLVVSGDLTGDIIYYCIGRFGGSPWIRKYGKYVGMPDHRVEKLESHFKKHPGKTFIFGKLAHGMGSLVLTASGLARVSFWQFLFYNTIATLPKSFILIMLGFYFGSSYQRVLHYLDVLAIAFFGLGVLMVAMYIYLPKLIKKFIKDKKLQEYENIDSK